MPDSTVRLEILGVDGSVTASEECLKFNFKKEYYTPFTLLSGVFVFGTLVPQPAEITFFIGGKRVHHGLIERLDQKNDFKSAGGRFLVTLVSKGFTSLLTQTSLAPVGVMSNVSINMLMSWVTLPNVTHEQNWDTQNFVYVREHSTAWENVANLAYKLNGMYPYIDGTNTVRITPKPDPVSFAVTEPLSRGIVHDYNKVVSRWYMRDPYLGVNAFDARENPEAAAMRIVRQKYAATDYNYLDNLQAALDFRLRLGMRGNFGWYVEYLGYNGEDLMDSFTADGWFADKRITKLEVAGANGKITTRAYAYKDAFVDN